MKNFFILRLLDKVSPIINSFGIDYPMMRKILQIKLVMDERRVPTIMMNGNNSKAKNSFRSSLFLYAFIGLFIGVFLFTGFPLFLKMNIIIGMLIFMIMTTMISDFSSVLLDVNDKNVLLPRPVDAKTLNAAKLIHIVIYLFSITMAISGGSLILGLIRYGFWFLLVFLLEIALICGLVILFTSLLYYAILTVFSGEKLKDIINYFQIALTVFMTVAYQFIGRIFNVSNLNMKFTPHWWDFLLPSTWFSAPFSLLMEHTFSLYYILLSLVGIIVPIITFTLYVKVVAPRFERNLQKLNSSGSSSKNQIKKTSLRQAACNLICFHPLEKVFFRFTVRMLSNERKLKLKLYPQLALAAIIPLIFFLSFFENDKLSSETFTQITQGKYYLYMYFSIAFLPPLFSMISTSENYKGAWIYKALPVENPAMVLKGAFKGFLYKFIIPIYLFISLVFLAIFGFKIVADLALIFINMLILMLIIFRFSNKELPFYKDFQYTKNGNNVGIVLASMGLCGLLAAIHYGIAFVSFGIAINIGASLVITSILWHSSFHISWEDIAEDAQ
jgi:hypothetical protein